MRPFGWYDGFNDVLHRTEESAQAAMKGGNAIVPLYARPVVAGIKLDDIQRVSALHQSIKLIDENLRAVPIHRLSVSLALCGVEFSKVFPVEVPGPMYRVFLGERRKELVQQLRELGVTGEI